MRSSNRRTNPANGATWTMPKGSSGMAVIGSMLPQGRRTSKNSLGTLPARPPLLYLPVMNLLLALAVASAAPLDTATFAGGCFWSMERAFDQVDGVESVTVGYTGGHTLRPSYEEVSTGPTGHLESVQVVYDPRKITYDRLVDAFWHDIDPTQPDGQFCDLGDEYRTAIFYRDSAQHRVAAASRRALERRFGQPITTQIVRATGFYPAEAYHQHYYSKNPVRYGMYRAACGRDRRLAEVWGAATPHAEGHATMLDTKPSDAEDRKSTRLNSSHGYIS